jgi:molybdopterin-guanine dinucleotide biosynthesis protein A
MKEIDARGLGMPCTRTSNQGRLTRESPNGVRVVVDNAASQQNVQRFLESQGFETALEQVGADYVVIGSCDSMPSAQPQPATDDITARPKRSW